ncbi:glucuronate isomerase [Shigella flexneri]
MLTCKSALTKRLDHFAAHGCKVLDHALDVVMFAEANEAELDSILARRLAGQPERARSGAVQNCPPGVPGAEMHVAAGYSSTTSARCV